MSMLTFRTLSLLAAFVATQSACDGRSGKKIAVEVDAPCPEGGQRVNGVCPAGNASTPSTAGGGTFDPPLDFPDSDPGLPSVGDGTQPSIDGTTDPDTGAVDPTTSLPTFPQLPQTPSTSGGSSSTSSNSASNTSTTVPSTSIPSTSTSSTSSTSSSSNSTSFPTITITQQKPTTSTQKPSTTQKPTTPASTGSGSQGGSSSTTAAGDTATFDQDAPAKASDGAPHLKLKLAIKDRSAQVLAAFSHVEKVSDLKVAYDKREVPYAGTTQGSGDFVVQDVKVPADISFKFDGKSCSVSPVTVGFAETSHTPRCDN